MIDFLSISSSPDEDAELIMVPGLGSFPEDAETALWAAGLDTAYRAAQASRDAGSGGCGTPGSPTGTMTPTAAAQERDSTEQGTRQQETAAAAACGLLETAPSLAAAADGQLAADADVPGLMEEGEEEEHEPAAVGVAAPTPAVRRSQRTTRAKQAVPVPAARQPQRKPRAKRAKAPPLPKGVAKQAGWVTRRVREGQKVLVLRVPSKCPGCGRPPLSQEVLDHLAEITKKAGRRKTKPVDPMDPRNLPHNQPTEEFYRAHVGVARTTLRDLKVYHGLTACTASRKRTSPHSGRTATCCDLVATKEVA
ncbi:hypothetical protein ABPG75_007881 [Micractinium tetrahymenae]